VQGGAGHHSVMIERKIIGKKWIEERHKGLLSQKKKKIDLTYV
jgi:hypothetical protein